MNSNSLESILRSAPVPPPPSELAADLRREIRLTAPAVSTREPFWKRWWPVALPGSALVALATVVTIQQAEITRLETELHTVATSPVVESGTVPAAPTTSPAATVSSPEARPDPRAELMELRARVAALQQSLATEGALVAETERLNAELAAVQASLPPEVAAMAEAHQRAERIRCVNNLKQLGLAVRIYASDHQDDFPADLKSIVPYAGDGGVFVCPSDSTRSTPEAGSSKESRALNSSYEFTAPGPGAFETEPSRVCFICPIHRNVTLCDGSVQQLTAERFAALVRRDGKIYLEPNATIEGQPKP